MARKKRAKIQKSNGTTAKIIIIDVHVIKIVELLTILNIKICPLSNVPVDKKSTKETKNKRIDHVPREPNIIGLWKNFFHNLKHHVKKLLKQFILIHYNLKQFLLLDRFYLPYERIFKLKFFGVVLLIFFIA